MVKIHINQTKHITIAVQHYIQYITHIPYPVLTEDVNAHSTLWHSYTDDHRGQLIADAIINSDHITINANTPTRVPNTILQCCCCQPTPITLASGRSPIFPLVLHQPAVHSLRRGCCCCWLPTPMTLASGGVRCSRLWSTSQLLRPSGQQCSHSGGVCPQIQGWQCGVYVGAVEEMMCVV